MTNYFSRKEYTYSTGDAIFSIPFDYISKEHIKVYVNNIEIENYTYLNNSQIQILDTLTTGDTITIYRSTPINQKLVTFSDTSILNKDVQNLAQTQVFDAIQEMRDDNTAFQIDVENGFDVYKDEVDTALENIAETANTAETNSAIAINTANTALTNSQTAIDTANNADLAASSAVSTANTALSTANTANSNASLAVNTSNTANTNASIALTKANTSMETANTALSNSQSAVVTAGTANTNASSAISTANTANTNASNALSIANNAADNASTALTNSQNAVSTANEATAKVNTFEEDIEEVIEAAENINQFETAVQTATTKAQEATAAATNATNAASAASTAAQTATTKAQEVIDAVASIPQSDWNQTDNTAKDYIKNKPDLSVKQDKSNLVTSWGETPSDTKYPSEKLVYDSIQSSSGSSVTVDDAFSSTSENPIQNKVITNLLYPEKEADISKIGTNTWSDIAYGNGKYVAVGTNGYITSSTDGVNWSTPVQIGTDAWLSVTYGNGMFVAIKHVYETVNYRTYKITSTDGVNWTSPTSILVDYSRFIRYANNKFLVFMGQSKYKYGTSTDGTTWSSVKAINSLSGRFQGVICANGMFVGVGTNGYILTTTDGATWNTTQLNSSIDWKTVGYGDGKFIVLSTNGDMTTSTDGLTWTEPALTNITNINSITYGNEKFVGVGVDGYITTSLDGINWTTPVKLDSSTLSMVIYNNNKFVAAGNNGYIVTQESYPQYIEYVTNKVSALSPSCTNEQYPSAKCVHDALQSIYPVVETYSNGASWYRIYAPDSSGYRWCEMGGLYYKGSTLASTDNTITFLKTFKDLNYFFLPTPLHSTANLNQYQIYEKYTQRTTSSTVLRTTSAIFGYAWTAKGYIEN